MSKKFHVVKAFAERTEVNGFIVHPYWVQMERGRKMYLSNGDINRDGFMVAWTFDEKTKHWNKNRIPLWGDVDRIEQEIENAQMQANQGR